MARASKTFSKWWWELDGETDNLATGLVTYFNDVQTRSAPRLIGDLENLRLYGAPQTSPYLGGGTYQGASPTSPYSSSTRVTVSLAQACIDTLTSKLSMDEPRALFITSGGDFAAQQLSEQLQSFTDGIFYETKTYDTTLRAFVDAGIFGTGFIHVFRDDENKIAIERAFPYEMFVDDADALYGAPRNQYRVKYIDRGVLTGLYPDFADQIAIAEGLRHSDMETLSRNNLVRVIEAWHLPSKHGAKDGRHVIAVSNTALLDETWERDSFPFATLRYNPKEVGFFGQGLCEMLASLQTELNTLLRKIQICMHFLAIPHWLKPSGSNIGFGSFNNQIGSVINYTGVPPELKIWASVPAECFRHVDWLYEKAFEMSGVSQMSAQSKMPGYGTMSGAALREYSDVESDRFQSLGKAWQRFHMDLAQLYIDEASAIAKDKGSYPVTFVKKSPTGKAERLETIDWKDIKLKERKYQIMISPVSKFPTEAPGIIQTGQEMVQAGLMDADTFKDLMNFPDAKAEQDLERAARKLVHKVVFRILDAGKYQAPDDYMDLAYAMKYATLKLNMAIADEMPDDRVELLRTWISACDDIQQEAAATAAAGMGPGGPGAGAQVGAPPVGVPTPGVGVAPPPAGGVPTGAAPGGMA